MSLFDLCSLIRHVIFPPSRNSGGDCYQPPWLMVLNPVDNLSKITVQWSVKNLHSPPGGLHFPSCGSRLSSEVRDLAR